MKVWGNKVSGLSKHFNFGNEKQQRDCHAFARTYIEFPYIKR